MTRKEAHRDIEDACLKGNEDGFMYESEVENLIDNIYDYFEADCTKCIHFKDCRIFHLLANGLENGIPDNFRCSEWKEYRSTK